MAEDRKRLLTVLPPNAPGRWTGAGSKDKIEYTVITYWRAFWVCKHFENIPIEFTAEDILRGQGINPERASARLYDFAEAAIEETRSLIEPAALYRSIEISALDGLKAYFTGGFFEGSLVARAMSGAEKMNICLCTIGIKLENRIRELMNEDPVSAVTLDGAGIAALHKVSQTVEDLISAGACETETSLGMRIQPGQEGWPIEQQRLLFKLLPADKIKLSLTETCLMIPRKSVSFVIPEGKNLATGLSPCSFCSKRNRCAWRKDKQTG